MYPPSTENGDRDTVLTVFENQRIHFYVSADKFWKMILSLVSMIYSIIRTIIRKENLRMAKTFVNQKI